MEKWEEAFEDHKAGMKYKDIAAKHGVSLDTVKNWKRRKWPKVTPEPDTKSKQRCQKGVKEKELRGAPKKNQNATVAGLYAKWLPEEIKEILGVTPDDPLEILWHNIQLQQAKIIRSFQLQYVKDEADVTTRVIHSSDSGDTYQYHEAFEKDNAFLQGLSRAMSSLNSMVAQYQKMLNDNPELATEFQKARLEQMQMETQRIKAETARLEAEATGTEGEPAVIVDDIPDGADPDDSQAE